MTTTVNVGIGSPLTPSSILPSGALEGQALIFNGANWAPDGSGFLRLGASPAPSGTVRLESNADIRFGNTDNIRALIVNNAGLLAVGENNANIGGVRLSTRAGTVVDVTVGGATPFEVGNTYVAVDPTLAASVGDVRLATGGPGIRFGAANLQGLSATSTTLNVGGTLTTNMNISAGASMNLLVNSSVTIEIGNSTLAFFGSALAAQVADIGVAAFSDASVTALRDDVQAYCNSLRNFARAHGLMA